MSPKVGTFMGKFSLIAGVRQERITNMAAVRPASAILRKRKKESLYIMLEVTGDPSWRERVYHELIRIIGEEYFQTPGSVTARLRQAIGAANSFLLQENLNSLPHEQRAGSVTCTVLREGNVYIAQAGPTVAYVSYQGKLKSFPESPATDLTAEEATPLGFKTGMPIRFYRSKVGIGDFILLTSGVLAQQTNPAQITKAILGKDTGPALASLEELAGKRDASAMLIRVAPLEDRSSARRQAAVRRSVRPRVMETPPEERPVRPRVVETPPEERPVRPRVVETPPEERPVRPRVTETPKEPLSLPDWDSLRRRASSLLGNALRGASDFLRRLLPEREASDSTEAPKVGPAEATQASATGRRAPRSRRSRRPVEERRNLWMSLAIVIPIIVVILVMVVYWQQVVARQARFNELVGQVQQQMQLIERVDEATARGRLLEARESLAEAKELIPDDPQVEDLQEQTNHLLNKIDKVTVLDWIATLREYEEPGSAPSRVIVEGIDVYVLDRGLDRVYKHLLNDTMQALQQLEVDPVLLRKGDQRDSIVVGDLVDVIWAKAESGRLGSNLLVLESGGSLLEYNPDGGISVLPVGGSDQWIQPQVAGSYQGNFYLLDASLNQILRHKPNYDSLPEGYFANPGEVDLAGAVDMALDGQIYILYANGRILKFLGGQPAPFEVTGLYEPLQDCTTLFTNEETEFLYVADVGNSRIVQLTKEGGFQRQFRAGQGEAFASLKGMFALERYNLLYFVSGNRLYVTNIPSE